MRRPPPRPAGLSRLFLPVAIFLSLGTSVALGSGHKKRDPSIAIRFYAQVYAFDPSFTAKVTIGNPPREIVIEKIASISERDIASFYPYRASDGSYSVVIQLDRHGSATLEAVSAQKIGLVLIASVSGRLTAALKVDKPISDGIIFIPSGLTVADIRAMGASFSLMGETEAELEARRTKSQKPPNQLETGSEAFPSPAR